MKNVKRLMSLVLAMSLVLSFSLVSHAEDNPYDTAQEIYKNSQYTVTVRKLIENVDYYANIGNFSEGLAVFQETKDNIIRFGFVDKQGTITMVCEVNKSDTYSNPKYYETYEWDGNIKGEFHDGLLVARRYNEMLGGVKYGFLDRNGKEAIPFEYDGAESFIDGYALVSKDGYNYIIDATGKSILSNPIKTTNVNNLVNLGSERFFRCYIDENNVGIAQIVDAKGKDIFYQTGQNSMAYLIDQYVGGSGVRTSGFFDLECVFGYSDGVLPISLKTIGDDIRFIDLDGKEIGSLPSGYKLTSNHYEKQVGFSEGLIVVYEKTGAAIYDSGKCGYADKTGKIVIEPKFDKADNFRDGCAAVSMGGWSCGYIDKTGKLIIPYSYDYNPNTPDNNYFINGFLLTQSPNGYYGDYYLLNTNGDVLYTMTNGKTSGGGSTINQYDGIRFNDNAVLFRLTVKEGAVKVMGTMSIKVDRYDVCIIEITETKEAKPPVAALTATPTSSKVLVNGTQVAFDAYEIAGNNYFKLRDIAFKLSGTEKQFEVSWDGAANAISLTSGKPYTVVGGEMEGKGGGAKTPVPNNAKILIDGIEVQLTAYTIDGNNYFKLRDLGAAFDFGVDWDGANNTIAIDTNKGYTP